MRIKLLMAVMATAICSHAIAQEEVTTPVRTLSGYGKNVIAAAPLQITERGVGVGLSYERVLDKEGIVALYIPIVYTFADDNYGYNYYNRDKRYSVQFMPGLKIYPTGYDGKVRYSVGPNLYFAYGEETYTEIYYPPYYGPYPGPSLPPVITTNNDEHVTVGMLVNNTLNINPTRHLFLALELGLGVTYMNKIDGVNAGTEALAQFGMKVGYRF